LVKEIKHVSDLSNSVFGKKGGLDHVSQIKDTLEQLDVSSKALTSDFKLQQERLKELTLHVISVTSNRI
jgi:chaperonin cofactor prefoldin